jgi:hypothetical protein
MADILVALASTRAKNGADLDFGHPSTRRQVGFVLDEHTLGLGITGELPPIVVGALVEGSCLNAQA